MSGDTKNKLIVCGVGYDVDAKVINWHDDKAFDAYTPHCIKNPSIILPSAPAKGCGSVMRLSPRADLGQDKTLASLQKIIHQFVIHLDGLFNAQQTMDTLHDERGLSVHFILDGDGTIFQCMDLADLARQAAGVNRVSVGVELVNRGDAARFPDAYVGKKDQRDKVVCTIHRHQYLAFDFTKAQYSSMVKLGRVLARLFPNLPQAYPSDGSGEQIWTALDGEVKDFKGYLGHFHITQNKWDPGPWDFKKFISQIRGRTFYPAIPGKEKIEELPNDSEKAEEIAHELYDNNEKEGDAGWFPIGPFGWSLLWHSGIHVRGDRGTPVVSPFAGKVVAARFSEERDWPKVGSNNFVLIKHETAGLNFFTLLMHVDEETDKKKMPAWFKASADNKQLKHGEVALLDMAVNGGEVVAHFGEAGPLRIRSGQIHFEIMAAEDVSEKIEFKPFWAKVDGSHNGRFATVPSIYKNIDFNGNNILEPAELSRFYHAMETLNPALRDGFRKMAVKHLSEWGDNGDFQAALESDPEFRGYKPAQRQALYTEQVEKFFWYTDEVAKHTGLPKDKMIWSYHPVSFVLWVHEATKGKKSEGKGISTDASSYAGKPPPDHIKDDASAGAEGFVDDEDMLFDEKNKNLDLETMSNGFPD